MENQAEIHYSAAGVSVLTDGVRAASFYDEGHWAGIEGDDLSVVIDLQKSQNIRQVGIGLLTDQESWIFLPQKIEVSFSHDGVHFNLLEEKELGTPVQHTGKKIEDVNLNFEKASGRFVRIIARNIGTCPKWHYGNGGPAWVFADEIWVK
ncbi:MAG TPA: discoidin domain-containing protein [Bacteroidetes bacterium]|nr:discoidin domain-containing protein [Bacteroidota bacterium]